MSLDQIKNYLLKRHEVSMAFIFGSVSLGSAGDDSDLDIAIYFKTPNGEIEWESHAQYPTEDRIWLDLERLAGREVDLLVLNRAPATIVDTILREGRPLFVRNRKTYLDLLLRVGNEAEDYRNFVVDFFKIKHA